MLWGQTVRSPHAHAQDRRARHLRGRPHARRARRAHPRRRPGREDLRARVRGPARSRERPRPLLRRARRAGRRRRAGAGAPSGRRGQGRVPAPRAGRSTWSARPSRSRSIPNRPTMAHGYRDDERPNVVRHIVIRHGDPDAEGDVTVTGVYDVGIQDQAFLGPESGLAVPDGEGGVDIYVATQWLHVDRDQVAPCLDLPPDMVRIHLAGVGGAFGGREDLSMQIHGAMLALHTKRPVKIVYNREESFFGHVHRHPARIWCEHRATRAGELVAVRMRILLDGGAYASSSTAVTSNAACFAVGPVRGRQRADRVDLRLHEQPALRGDARLRRRPDLLRGRGADGQARRCARDRPGRAPAPQRARPRRQAADRPADRRLAAGRRGHPPRRRPAAARAGGASARGDPPPRRRRQHDPRRGRSPRRRLRGRLQEHLLLGGVRRLHGRARAPAGRTARRRSTARPPRSARASRT